MKLSKKYKIGLIAILVIAAIGAGVIYNFFYSSNTAFEEKSQIIFIPVSVDLNEWLEYDEVKNLIANPSSFKLVANLKRFSKLKPGRYRIQKNKGNLALVNMFRSGDQEAIHLRTDDVEDIYALAGKLGKNLQSDSTAFIDAFLDKSFCEKNKFNQYTVASLMIPNTYDFFWTTTPQEFLERMQSTYAKYWSTEKIGQAQKLGMIPTEVATLASIVKAEAGRKDEAPKIAGLYMNRLKSGMALQSDPTAVFGRKEHAQRVYLSDLQNDSPYNTYQHTGLPPGPINFPETSYLEAVLNYEKHDYIFMCAQAGGTGYHNFSRTLDQHNLYRREYTSWLEKNGVH